MTYIKKKEVFPMEKPVEKPDSPCACLDDLPLAMAYVPMQKWRNLYPPATALDRGTIFAELDLPFIGEEAVPDGK